MLDSRQLDYQYLKRILTRQLANWLDAGYTTQKQADQFIRNVSLLARSTNVKMSDVLIEMAADIPAMLAEADTNPRPDPRLDVVSLGCGQTGGNFGEAIGQFL